MLRSIIKSKLKVDKKYWELIRVMVFVYDKNRQLATILQLEEIIDDGLILKSLLRFVPKEKLEKDKSDIYDESVLICFIKKYSLQGCKNMVVLWGHGNGFGLGYFIQRLDQSLRINYFKDISFSNIDKALIDKVNKLINVYLSIRAIFSTPERNDLIITSNNINLNLDFLTVEQRRRVNEEKRFQQLTAAQLSNIFKTGFASKVELLLINSCYMQMLESIPFFSNVATYIVGSQTTFPFLGYDYELVFDGLQKHVIEEREDIEIVNMSSIAVESLSKKYKKQPFISTLKDYYQSEGISYDVEGIVSNSLISLKEINQYLSTINAIGYYFDTNFDTIKNIITSTLENIETVIIESTYLLFIDIEYFFSEYNKKDKNFKTLYKRFKNDKKIIIKYKKANKNEGFPKGLSMLLPKTIGDDEVKSIIVTVVENAFQEGSILGKELPKWGAFLKKWLAHL